ncbi:MAG TPA: hypothetical protein VLV78_04985 [Thermoanaerobaculia bacterium]|nr:hypothetical protein [Thermoanaerobaculia bacterium]
MNMLAIALVLLFGAQQMTPTDAQGWFDLGMKRQEAADFRGAVEAFEKAKEMGYTPRPLLNVRIARAYAQSGEKDKALTLLEQMAANGYGPAETLFAEDDFAPLRSDARWKKLIETMNKNAHPCKLAPEFRQFDYWLGEWDVEIGGQIRARSSIQLILDDCVIFENYTDFRGYAGKSFSLYDATTKKWEQRYVDTTGALHHWTGGLQDGRMVFFWKTQQNGKDSLLRMSYDKEGPDRVRQKIDTSTDDGKTWSPGYNGLYIRRK